MTTNLLSLGQNLRLMRKDRHLTLVEVSKLTGLAPSFLSGVELGDSMPSFATLRSLASAYGESITVCVETDSEIVWSNYEI